LLQWAKRSLATALGDKKDIVKNWKIIKKLNDKANIELDRKYQQLLKENYHSVLKIIYSSDISNYDIWLDFGTLLGMYRDKGLIKHDQDMDFGIIIEDYNDFQEKENLLLCNGFKKTRELYYDNEIMEISYDYNGLNVDFIIYKREGNCVKSVVVGYLLDALNRPCKFESSKYAIAFSGLKEHDVDGIKVKIPVNTHEYLEYQYEKDFLIPNKFYNWRDNPMYEKVDESLVEVKLLK
jgi:hypothetical protein